VFKWVGRLATDEEMMEELVEELAETFGQGVSSKAASMIDSKTSPDIGTSIHSTGRALTARSRAGRRCSGHPGLAYHTIENSSCVYATRHFNQFATLRFCFSWIAAEMIYAFPLQCPKKAFEMLYRG
jgi:hypothetical protein